MKMVIFRALVFSISTLVATHIAFAGSKRVTSVTANHQKFHYEVRHATTVGVGQTVPAGEGEYLNVQTHNARQPSDSLLNSGEAGPYGFQGPTYPDDEIGFYKNDYEAYENSPLDGYYSWSGRVSP